MRALIVPAVAAVLLLAGCVPGPAPDPTTTGTVAPSSSATSTPSPTPTSDTPAATPVDPAQYATNLLDIFGDGVDFDSVDGNVHCGIWTSRGANALDGPTTGSYAGCRPLMADYATDPSSTADGNVGCSGGQLFANLPTEPVCNNGTAFAGEDGLSIVNALPVGSSITYAGVTCTSPDEATIECIRENDGAGFTVSRTSYRYF